MKSLSTNLIAEKNKLHSGNVWLVLLEITLTDDTVIRLVNNTENITYGGNVYTRFAFDLGIVEADISGQIPMVRLRVCNVTRFLTPYLNSLDGGLESTVKITVVNSGHLTEDFSELELEFNVITCEADEKYVVWQLGMANPRNQRFPLYRYLADHCLWAGNFKGAECGYSGSETTCDGTLDTCREYGNTSRFCGFSGMAEDGIKIA